MTLDFRVDLRVDFEAILGAALQTKNLRRSAMSSVLVITSSNSFN